MPVVLPPGPILARRGHPLAHALVIAMLAVPIVIATLALTPALIICPFLSSARQRLAIRLLASLRQWTLTLIRASSDRP
jgi:hypothetical protein